MSVETELHGYKRQIQKAQEQNEQLTYMHNRIESDVITVKKQIVACQNKQEALKIEYSKYNRALNETEHQLNRAQVVSCVFLKSLCAMRYNMLIYCLFLFYLIIFYYHFTSLHSSNQ